MLCYEGASRTCRDCVFAMHGFFAKPTYVAIALAVLVVVVHQNDSHRPTAHRIDLP